MVAFAGLQFTTPGGRIHQSISPIEAHTHMTPPVAAILDRSGNDCHSDKIKWPWYSHLALVSWLVIEDVNDARRAMNLSEWSPGPATAREKLLQICDEVADGAMPLSVYTPMHPGSKLTPDDVKTLCDWTKAEAG